MADDRMAVLDTVRKATADGDTDFLREGVRVLAEAVMEAEVTELTGVPHGERAPDRRLTSRNGYWDRRWDTRVGTIGLAIPKVRDGGRVVSMAALVATGVASTGERRILGLELAAGNDEGSAWPAFIRSLVDRGLSGVRLVISDDHRGLVKAVGEQFLGSGWQRSSVSPSDPLDRPPRAPEQGDQAPDGGRRHLPGPGRGHPPGRDGPRRAAREGCTGAPDRCRARAGNLRDPDRGAGEWLAAAAGLASA